MSYPHKTTFPSASSVRFLDDQCKVAARLELLASKTYSVRMDRVRVLFSDDLNAMDRDGRTLILDKGGKPLVMTGD